MKPKTHRQIILEVLKEEGFGAFHPDHLDAIEKCMTRYKQQSIDLTNIESTIKELEDTKHINFTTKGIIHIIKTMI